MSKRVKILRETMRAAEEGRYFAGEKEVKLPYSFEKIKEVTPNRRRSFPAPRLSKGIPPPPGSRSGIWTPWKPLTNSISGGRKRKSPFWC